MMQAERKVGLLNPKGFTKLYNKETGDEYVSPGGGWKAFPPTPHMQNLAQLDPPALAWIDEDRSGAV